VGLLLAAVLAQLMTLAVAVALVQAVQAAAEMPL
jgi:hypothetical protein